MAKLLWVTSLPIRFAATTLPKPPDAQCWTGLDTGPLPSCRLYRRPGRLRSRTLHSETWIYCPISPRRSCSTYISPARRGSALRG
ncbi:hypothetical protein VFPBJ_09166 [Purpureocillium lilacinum]|uniref:Secreted protein n=1 Tax=Purpureocillium lilacinum TaxID=33203 RepID=A0A179GCS3_PURLI|nr:hypothetical protein VFPBJ_09166 [Purpureocillium lilacinum]